MLKEIGKNAKIASRMLSKAKTAVKENALIKMAEALVENEEEILKANLTDVENARQKGMSNALVDRLSLNHNRILSMSEGIKSVCALPDPVGEVLYMHQRPNGLQVGKKRVPMGVVAIIYEARPNVTADAAALCIKTANSVILRGGSEAINSNTAIVRVLRKALRDASLDENCIQLIEDTSRETAAGLMKLNGYVDVLIPRGGAGLIQNVIMNATVPVIETGLGNCHIYVDGECDEEMAVNIVVNAKISRPGVCNAAETLLIDSACAEKLLPKIAKALRDKNCQIRGCEKTLQILGGAGQNLVPATENDFEVEFLDYIIAAKVVNGIEDAIEHIEKYSTGHSEAIVTSSYEKAQKFLNEVDSAAVYVNASTRFTDGAEFGFGAEIGISTQKLHARGPMGLEELTTTKYIVYGNGQIR
jgi:glutamate-5-semialdehyde dehydrogenase